MKHEHNHFVFSLVAIWLINKVIIDRDFIYQEWIIYLSTLTGPWQVRESSSASSHWPSHSTQTDSLAYSRISLSRRKVRNRCREGLKQRDERNLRAGYLGKIDQKHDSYCLTRLLRVTIFTVNPNVASRCSQSWNSGQRSSSIRICRWNANKREIIKTKCRL